MAALLLLCSCAAPPAPAPTPTPEPLCAVTGKVHHGATPVVAAAVTASASKQVSERQWSGVGRVQTTTAEDGGFAVELPCGAKFDLLVHGWNFNLREVWIEPGMAPLKVDVISALLIDLVVIGPDGERVEATLDRGHEVVPISTEGTDLHGILSGDVAGVIRSPGLPDRTWVPDRSDVLQTEHQGHLLASVRLGPTDVRWLVPPGNALEAEAWCVADGARGDSCQHTPGSRRCVCPGGLLAWRAPGWDVAALTQLDGPELVLKSVPPSRRVCFTGAGPAAKVGPAGVAHDLVVGTLAKPDGEAQCVVAPVSQDLTVTSGGRTWPIPAGTAERVAL